MEDTVAVGEKRPAEEQLVKEEAEETVEMEAEADTENDELEEDEALRRLAMAALALEDVYVVQGTMKP